MRIIDNAIALRILWLLITPIQDTQAYKIGLIDQSGTRIRKAQTSEENDATSMLHRLVWNLKKFINLVPGGSTRLGSMVAAYALVRECVETDNYLPTTEYLNELYAQSQTPEGLMPLDEMVEVQEILSLLEDAPASNTAGASVSEPAIKKKLPKYSPSKATFDALKNGRSTSRRIGEVIRLESLTDTDIFCSLVLLDEALFVVEHAGAIKLVRFQKTQSATQDVSDHVRIASTHSTYIFDVVDHV